MQHECSGQADGSSLAIPKDAHLSISFD